MKEQLKEFEIPFGAKDSELCGWKYTIPEGMEATIVDNKIVVKKKESEDEKIKNEITELIMRPTWKTEEEFQRRKELCAWVEKQCEHANFLNKIHVGDKVTRNKDGMLVNLSQLNRVAKKYEKQGEQKPADLPKGEDYGIDGLYHAIRILEETLGKVEGYQTDDGILEHKCAINAIKELYAHHNFAWSEEDRDYYDAIIAKLELTRYDALLTDNQMAFLKSFKDRYFWKPSDAQIASLTIACDRNDRIGFDLTQLLRDLKKLKE